MSLREPNPYRPGFNQAPTELAGRESVLSAAREALDTAAFDARTPRPLVLVGTRGVGKTVILGEIAALAAEAHSWPTAAVEVRPGGSFTDRLTQRLRVVTQLFDEVRPGRRLRLTAATVRAGALGIGGELTLAPDPRPQSATPPLEEALAGACEAAIRRGGGVVVSIDELQLVKRAELAEFTATIQEHVADAWPLVVVAAGLPSIRDPQRSVTYLERGAWHELGLLDRSATLRAIVLPARSAGRPCNEDAAQRLADASGGYPYAIQVLGHHAWRASTGAARILLEHATQAVAAAEVDLAAGLYEARWLDASRTEQTYLVVLARLTVAGGRVTGAEVAAALGKPASAVSYLRDRLLKKGTIFADDRALSFVAPGMASWVLARSAD